MLNNLDDYIEAHKKSENSRILEDRQFTAFEDIRDHLEKGERDGYITLPTGIGKTVLFSEVVEALHQKTLIVVPKKNLVDQTINELKIHAPGLTVGRIFGDAKEFGNEITVTTYDSLLIQVEKWRQSGGSDGIDPKIFDCLILDEAHRSLSVKRAAAIDEFTSAIRLGFSATPEFNDEKGLRKLLTTEIHSMETKEAIEGGLLSDVTCAFRRTKVNLSSIKIQETADGHDFDQKALEKAVNVAARNESAMKMYQEYFSGKTAIAFCAGVDHAENLAELFRQNNISAAVITGKTSRKDTQKILTAYKDGSIKVLCSADKLIEGFNEPRASVAFMLRPTLSQVVAQQRGGRVLRLDPNDEDKIAYIIDFIDEYPDETKPGPITYPEILGAVSVNRLKKKSRRFGGVRINQTTASTPRTNIIFNNIDIITSDEEIVSIYSKAKKMREEELEVAEDGDIMISALATELGIAIKTIERQISNLELSNPEYCKKNYRLKRGKGNRRSHYISAELADNIRQGVRSVENGGEDWITTNALVRELRSNADSILELARKNLTPEYVAEHYKWRKNSTGSASWQFSRELADKIRAHVGSFERPKKGDVTVNGLAAELDCAPGTIKERVEKLEKESPEFYSEHYRSKYRPTGLQKNHYLSAEFADIIRKEFNAVERAGDGEMPTGTLARELQTNERTVLRCAQAVRIKNPAYFDENQKLKRGVSGNVDLHYSPDLKRMIVAEFNAHAAAQPGEITIAALKRELGVDRTTLVRAFAEEKIKDPGYVDTNYQWRKIETGQKAQLLSPALADIIRSKIKSKKKN